MIGRFALALALGSSLWMASTAQAQRDPSIPHAQDRPPGPALSPEEAIRKMKVPEGFQVELVASEPDIVNPVAMIFDERGRVWITESLEYPRKSAGPGRDRVKILEDSDGDGKADKFTIFADGLNIPSGIAVGAGGVWVANAPDILFMKDTDGDGKADTREVVVTGFGRFDTHELPNSLTWGPDGYLYGWNGVFNPASIDYRGKHYEFTCAVFRIDPKTRDFEVFCEGTSNPWGITWDKEGSAFASACVIDHLWHLTETGYYHRQGGPYPPFTWKLESIVDHKHQKAAYCGITYFDSDAYPAEYREKLFMGNIHGNGVNVDRLERNGSTYRGKTDPDFLVADDAWFMPVVQKVGPDGSLYVLDWYDRYHCYQDANRDPNGIDRLKGRLYRVRYRETPRAPEFDLARETNDQLIDRLGSPNIYYREVAQRLLRERNSAATRPRLEKLAIDPEAPEKTRLHALWALIGTGQLDPGIHGALLIDRDPTIRAWGVRAAGNFGKVAPAIRESMEALAGDPSPDVRLQVAVASRKIEKLDPLSTLIKVLDEGEEDPIIAPIVWQNLHPLLDDRGDDFARIVAGADLLKSPRLTDLLPRAVDRLLGGARVQPEAAALLVSKLLTGPQEAGVVSASRESMRRLAEKLRSGAISEAQRRKLRELLAGPIAPIVAGDLGSMLTADAASVAASWGDTEALRVSREILSSSKIGDEQRALALSTLVGAGDTSVLEIVAPRIADPGTKAALRAEMIASLGRLDDPKVAQVVLDAYPNLDPDLKPRVVELLTQRTGWTIALLDAIDRKDVNPSLLNVNQIRKLATSKDLTVADRARSIWGVVREERNPAREEVIARIKQSLDQAHGDPVAGVKVFQNVCGQCHKIFGEGQDVGPEITLNGRASYEQLLSNVFDPSLVIGTAYQATTVATTDGRVLTGLLVEDSPQRVVLKLQGGKLEIVPKSSVEESRLSALSLMPEGLEAQISPRELADLFAYITLDKQPVDPSARAIPGTPQGIRK
ncbi:PVC-type heme-binding CxxCH protein [Tundrisphaera lichenicola]|uniref:PVC-type heme-binding CxxCH protein n=1 Tax=Tundrisphaera lichenicola TaxID=2029860 RepID=UPI003EBAF375